MIAATVALLSFRPMHDWSVAIMVEQLSTQFAAKDLALVEAAFGAGGLEAMAEYAMRLYYAGYSYLMLIMCIPCALALRLFHGSRNTLAEVGVFSLYVVGHATLISAVFNPLLYVFYDMMPAAASASLVTGGAVGVLYAVYGAYAGRGFFGDTRAATGLTSVAMVIAYMVWLVLFSIVWGGAIIVPMVLAAS